MRRAYLALFLLPILCIPSAPARQAKKSKLLSPQEQRKLFVLPAGFEIELVAAEPLVANPITLCYDEQGRLLVSESHTYRYGPAGTPVKPFTNPVVRLQPKPGGLERVVIAEGFDDPVMGIAVRGGQLWLTANDYLYRYDYDGKGKATNRKTLVTDRNKAWNPFGMFVIEWGPEGDLYMSVGNHNIALKGPTNEMGSRGTGGIVVRMKPDGSRIERLVQGLRVPYSFEMDPFGQLWLLSNGQGNPDRFVRVIEGVDYHCFSRPGADAEWLAGRHPLAPPCLELPSGACTQLIRYYGSAYPADYFGSLFLDNWGAHGFDGANRCIFRYKPDERGDIVKKEKFLECKDPHFRPSHIVLDADGNLIVSDWYGRDDESDATGRIWRVKYVGKDAPGKPGADMAAARALWAGKPADAAKGLSDPDWKVRRLGAYLLQRYEVPGRARLAEQAAAKEKDPGVLVMLARLHESDARRDALLAALKAGAAKHPHTRYEAAFHLAPLLDARALATLLDGDDDQRLAGLIAIDVACFEGHPTKAVALKALNGLLAAGKELDHAVTLARMNADPSLTGGLVKLLEKPGLSASVVARAVLAVRAQGKAVPPGLLEKVGKQFVEAVRSKSIKVSTPADSLLLLSTLEADGPTPFALGEVGRHLNHKSAPVRAAAHDAARHFGPKAASLAGRLWAQVDDLRQPMPARLEALGTLAKVEAKPDRKRWEGLLSDAPAALRLEAIRSWRAFRGSPEMVAALIDRAPKLPQKAELAAVLPALGEEATAKRLGLTPDALDRKTLGDEVEAALSGLRPGERNLRVAHGRLVFERNACVKCHKVDEDTLRGPGLKAVGKGQKKGYLIESVLFPSAVIKTGFETERVVTKRGKVLSGVVRDEGTHLRVLDADNDVRVAKTAIETREVQKVSIMPEGQEKALSRREFEDLVAYLESLR